MNNREELFAALLKVAPFQNSMIQDRHIVLNGLKRLGLIDFIEVEDQTFLEARDKLAGQIVYTMYPDERQVMLSVAGAYAVLKILREAGFAVVRK